MVSALLLPPRKILVVSRTFLRRCLRHLAPRLRHLQRPYPPNLIFHHHLTCRPRCTANHLVATQMLISALLQRPLKYFQTTMNLNIIRQIQIPQTNTLRIIQQYREVRDVNAVGIGNASPSSRITTDEQNMFHDEFLECGDFLNSGHLRTNSSSDHILSDTILIRKKGLHLVRVALFQVIKGHRRDTRIVVD
ncbi:hypothetical protein GHT06_013018 [Daphnia sinensis]|uniref:Uncharacterized protein n=1 Tax=Daphnia sinensis TaxID=1820382 RepID=A0AAD5LQE2_9CRUS|nr:hypothetical protein GHT06_013018 [Daphnia sinensis]